IDFGQAQMPGYQSLPLTSSEKQCLASWVEGGEPEGCAEETPFGPKSSDESIPNVIENRSEEMGRVIDANASTVAVKVATTFHDFTINNISVTGVVSRLAGSDKRAFKIQLGLDSLNAGINARTVHAKKWLDITNFPSIEVEGVFSMNRPSPSVDVARPAVKVRGITRGALEAWLSGH
ncbi:MAG: hypothetical protein NTV34_07210, partial [Proteobacteria bacterium]|nr:hypothetical protein [Pseudomonadota bacterium]